MAVSFRRSAVVDSQTGTITATLSVVVTVDLSLLNGQIDSLSAVVSPLGLQGYRPCEETEMKDPRLGNIVPNTTISNEVILSSQLNSEEDPFAEYMWMEHEEEFNRQVRGGTQTPADVRVQVAPSNSSQPQTSAGQVR